MRNNYISRRVLDELSKEYSIFFKEEEILYIERYTEVIELKRNEFLIHKDDQLEYLYFVESGNRSGCRRGPGRRSVFRTRDRK